jgi:hypothetical protein
MTTAPMNPLAGPAGPGKYSTRTDKLKMGSIAYGEGVETAAIQSGAPLAQSPGSMPASEVMSKARPITSLYADTESPDEPITTGIDRGPGAGSEALQMRKEDDSNFRAAIQAAKPVLAYVADLPDTSPETRAIIKQLWKMS